MALDYVIGAFNICTDFLVFVIPTMIALNVQTTNQKKSIVIAAFATRPMYVGPLFCRVLNLITTSASAANIVQLYTLSRDFDPLNRTRKPSLFPFPLSLLNSRPRILLRTNPLDAVSAPISPADPIKDTEQSPRIVLNLSVITACIPSLQPLLTNLHSGLMDVTVHSESLTPSVIDTWNNRMQLSSHWKTPRTKRAGMEEYSGQGGTTSRDGTEVVELREGV